MVEIAEDVLNTVELEDEDDEDDEIVVHGGRETSLL